MNLGNFPFHQGNEVSSNGDFRIPVTPEKLYIQRPNPMLAQGQGYQSSHWPESSNPVLSPEVPVMQRSNPMLTEMPVKQIPSDSRTSQEQSFQQQLNFILAEMERNQIQSANWQLQSNDPGVVQDRPAKQLGNQIGNGWQKSLGLLKSFAPKQIPETPDPLPTQMQGNQRQNADWLESIELYSGILQDTPQCNIKKNLEIAGFMGDCESDMQGSAHENANSHVNMYGRDAAFGDLQLQVDLTGAKENNHTPADGDPYRGVCLTGMLSANRSYSHIGSNWAQQQCATPVQWQQDHTLGINQIISSCSLENKPSDGFPVPSQPIYNFASPPHVEYSEASFTANHFNIAPVTPEKQNMLRFTQLSAMEDSSVIESWSPEIGKQENVPTNRPGVINYSKQLLPGLNEKIPENTAYAGIDLNKTPEQKTPKRKKHRPKVVVEGKPKRSSKLAAPKAKISSDNPTGKRKYVRRKGLTASTSPDNEKSEIEAPTSGSATRSCRRELNFNSQHKEQENTQEINENIIVEQYFCDAQLNLNSQETLGLNRVSGIPAEKEGQQNMYDAGKLQRETSWNLTTATNQKLGKEAPQLVPKAHLAMAIDHVNVRNVKTQNGTPYKVSEQHNTSQKDQHVHVKADQMSSQGGLAWAAYKMEMKMLSQSGTNHISDSQVSKQKMGHKRDYFNIAELICSQFSGGHNETSRISEAGNFGTCKRVKSGELHRAPYSAPSFTATAENGVRHVQHRCMPKSSIGTEVLADRNNCEQIVMENRFPGPMVVGNNCQEYRSLAEEILNRDGIMRQTFQQKTEIQIPTLSTVATNQNMDCPPQRVSTTILENICGTSNTDAATKGQAKRAHSSIQEVSSDKVPLPKYKEDNAYLHSSRKARGKKEEKIHAITIDEIICRLKVLDISNSDQALVPYEGHGTIVPFEGFEPIRRRKPRPKVELDSETITQWNLLMGKATNEGTETDPDKEKWWEAEREVFRGRVDTFIARMHLVQGDRRFSPWKGSVVDSVIGVFLTQNVSDHLSSSAFMSLAAQFPLTLATTKSTSCCTPTGAWIVEPEVQIIDPDGTITYPLGALRQPHYKQDSTTSSDYSEQLSENLITATGVHSAEDNNGTSKEVVSSQNSSDSVVLQASEDVRSSSDSEIEEQKIFPNPNQIQNRKTERAATSPKNPCPVRRSLLPGLQQLDDSACLVQNLLTISKNVGACPINLNVLSSEEPFAPSTSLTLNFISDATATEPYFSVPPGKQSMSSFYPSEAKATKIQGVFPMNAGSLPVDLSRSTTQETGMANNHRSTMDRCSYPHDNVYSQPRSLLESFQPSININQKQSLKTRRPDEAQARQQSGDLFPSGENFESTGNNMSNERRKKNGVNKMREVDWDALRKQVLQQIGNKERGMDKVDSMDYEALRQADVNKISNAIRERGMNNMLAERIKDFLNRLVKDHGSIDLEWLRDVASDKAKDYLLSVRGLGLKSVECVRLLSLHHMAFPVDTNVGRIAVRLGWVPLQPLPESLQLHLLEMYPILESIQKYIWPRLCKLDQRTLYELHYQMITFGKVFCTKSKPNCNVCPMKGECRHFASAFASARLALPGPEERSMVSSSTPIAPIEDRCIIMEPLLLDSAESSLGRETQPFHEKCEPIVEEPTTPESSTEVTESDIEDMLAEDPNEIPVIKFSLESLKANVQNIMQEQNMQISEGDLSRALVALDPATASIPAPKLKNVSRLRTEHHVYELPDSHPVLEGLDRREPDDPSPYLLAIWTPGETANSIQPSENNCTLSRSGRLCDDNTCFRCNSIREADSQMVRGTILIPCRTAMRGSFPLNGTYFQVNEVFADHESSMNPIAVPRDALWHLRRRTVYFGTSVTTIFRGMPIEGIQYCFWRGFVCVRGFDRKTRAPRPLMARLHYPASKLVKNKKEGK